MFQSTCFIIVEIGHTHKPYTFNGAFHPESTIHRKLFSFGTIIAKYCTSMMGYNRECPRGYKLYWHPIAAIS